MFTGIIEELGTIAAYEPHAGGAKISISASIVTGDISDGDSIAVNGVCLTAIDVRSASFPPISHRKRLTGRRFPDFGSVHPSISNAPLRPRHASAGTSCRDMSTAGGLFSRRTVMAISGRCGSDFHRNLADILSIKAPSRSKASR